MSQEDQVRNAVSAYFAAIRALDADAWIATFAEDAVSHDPAEAPAVQGHTALRGFFEGLAGLFESCDMREESVFVNGTEAAVKWTATGRGRNGRDVAFEGIDFFDVNADGLVRRVRGYWNPGAVVAELTA